LTRSAVPPCDSEPSEPETIHGCRLYPGRTRRRTDIITALDLHKSVPEQDSVAGSVMNQIQPRLNDPSRTRTPATRPPQALHRCEPHEFHVRILRPWRPHRDADVSSASSPAPAPLQATLQWQEKLTTRPLPAGRAGAIARRSHLPGAPRGRLETTLSGSAFRGCPHKRHS
jgi:hypothetical protein